MLEGASKEYLRSDQPAIFLVEEKLHTWMQKVFSSSVFM